LVSPLDGGSHLVAGLLSVLGLLKQLMAQAPITVLAGEISGRECGHHRDRFRPAALQRFRP
jgi:hypothetical protein